MQEPRCGTPSASPSCSSLAAFFHTASRNHLRADLGVWSRVALGSSVLFFASAKLLTPHDGQLAISGSLYYGAALLELACAALLFSRLRRPAILLLLCIWIGGSFLGATSSSTSCGCLGSWMRLSRAQHVILAGCMGLLTLVTWLLNEQSKSRLALPDNGGTHGNG
jgi:hypothetical protein